MLPVKTTLLPSVSRFFEDDWNDLFNWSNRDFITTAKSNFPLVNIHENADNYTLEIAAPGMKKEDFRIEFHNNALTIKSDSKEEKKKESDNYIRREFNYHAFQQTFKLDNSIVDEAKIKASYEDGILSLNIPKKEEAKEQPARLIKIS